MNILEQILTYEIKVLCFTVSSKIIPIATNFMSSQFVGLFEFIDTRVKALAL